MTYDYDVFNGDADGLCALHQLRMAFPRNAQLITGVKREVQLVQRVPVADAGRITVLDISFDSNAGAVRELLAGGAALTYFDHHSAAEVFTHERLTLHIDSSPSLCTSLLVDRHLHGRFREWAITAAFGDNIDGIAIEMAQQAGFGSAYIATLQELGRLLNYNAYGERVEDLHVAPASLYEEMHQYLMPGDFIACSASFELLQTAYYEDLIRLDCLQARWQSGNGAIFVLPNEAWARRTSGMLANKLNNECRGKSFAVLTEKEDGSYLVSVRSAQPEAKAANRFCARFSGGGGRQVAAGINRLHESELHRFRSDFFAYF